MFVIVALWEIEKHDVGVASNGETLIPGSEKVGHIVII
jgi:H2-forming N5,N10-methylenetetrahydromethanopterin dehydrogenase-like enzyme